MTNTKFKLGEILKVSRKTNAEDYWYEKVIQTTPEIITEDMPEDAEADISKQGLTENFNYEVVETFKISSALKALHQAKIISSNLPVMPSLPSEEDIFQWAVKKSESFERNLLARQCFIEGAEYMRKCVERGNGA